MEENIASSEEKPTITTFKKPVLIGKIGRLPRKTTPVAATNIPPQEKTNEAAETSKEPDQEITSIKNDSDSTITNTVPEVVAVVHKDSSSTDQPTKELSYIEPAWSGLPISDIDYSFEILKSGVIIDTINLMKKSYWVFGRLPTCDIYQAHPTISRYHAVLQYKADNSADRPTGFYIYDLGSTHGTFLNKSKIKPNMYVRIQVGHMLKLGCSTRTFVLVGPEEDTENETELSITQLKIKRAEELKEREMREIMAAKELEEQKKREEERGIDWGMREDADEETDLAENPYAETNNEELYLEDPKKTLRGFMEREGHELHYDVTERGVGQFLCSVVLPIDDARGRPIVAEALVKGKKKEAVVQCALEACRILDRHGVLRQAIHESKKRKAKNWEENDYYDSDEDTFLDRTGTIERKRERRMKAKQAQQPETYQSLCIKEEKLSTEIRDIEKQLNDISQSNTNRNSAESSAADPLEQFMNQLNSNIPDKYTVGKMKNELHRLRKEHAEIIKLVNLARPAHLPPLVVPTASSSQEGASTSGINQQKKSLPMFGKRLKVKVMLPARNPSEAASSMQTSSVDNDEEEDDEPENKTETQPTTNTSTDEAAVEEVEMEDNANNPEQNQVDLVEDIEIRKGIIRQLKINMASCDENALASLDNKVKARISKTVTKLRKIAEEEELLVVDEKRLAVQKKKIFNQLNSTDPKNIEKHMKLSQAMTKMTNEYCTIGNRKLKIVEKINKLADDINNIAIEIRTVSKLEHERTVNRMKEFVEQAHQHQTEIFGELEKIEDSVSDQQVLDKLKELYEWLSSQKVNMLDNLERIKSVKLTEDTKLLEDIIEFELKSDNFITTILEEIRKIRENSEKTRASPSKRMKTQDDDSASSSSTNRLEEKDSSDDEDAGTPADSERRKKKNLRRIAQRQEKAEQEKKKQYEEDALKDDYNMWVPPAGQTGDGRTALNDKFGY